MYSNDRRLRSPIFFEKENRNKYKICIDKQKSVCYYSIKINEIKTQLKNIEG